MAAPRKGRNVRAVSRRAGAVLGVRDVAADQRSERARGRLAAVMESSPAAIQILGTDGTIHLWSTGAEGLYGCSAREMVGRNAYTAMPGETGALLRAVVEQLDRGVPVVGLAAQHERKDGSRVDVSVTASIIRSDAGEADGYCILCVNISSRRQGEQEVAEALDAARQRIGREVHDTLGQQITAIGLLVSTARNEAETGRLDATTLQHLEEMVGQARTQLRLLLKGVFPVAVDTAGLVWALYELAHETSELFRISCHVDGASHVAVADNFTATELYWIAREAVHNAVHHGRAREIVITLDSTEKLVLVVRDDGVGIPAKVDETLSLGLRTMRHRSGLIGGRLTIGPAPGGGTIVRCVVPLPGQPA